MIQNYLIYIYNILQLIFFLLFNKFFLYISFIPFESFSHSCEESFPITSFENGKASFNTIILFNSLKYLLTCTSLILLIIFENLCWILKLYLFYKLSDNIRKNFFNIISINTYSNSIYRKKN